MNVSELTNVDDIAKAVAKHLQSMPEESNRLLTAQQAANYLGISKRTFYDLKDEPNFPPPKKISGSMRWFLRDLIKYAEKC